MGWAGVLAPRYGVHTVIVMTWAYKYHIPEDFVSLFDNEQDYVDFMFSQIIMYNYGVAVQA